MSFTLLGFNHIKSLLSEGCLCTQNSLSVLVIQTVHRLQSTSAALSLTQSVAYIIVHLCIYITLPRQLFCSCCVGAADLRQSKALLTSDSHTHTHTHTLSHTHTNTFTRSLTHTHDEICQLVSGAQLTDCEESFSLLGS